MLTSHNMEIYSSESSPLASGGPALSNNQLIAGILLAVVHKEQLAGSAGERVGELLESSRHFPVLLYHTSASIPSRRDL